MERERFFGDDCLNCVHRGLCVHQSAYEANFELIKKNLDHITNDFSVTFSCRLFMEDTRTLVIPEEVVV